MGHPLKDFSRVYERGAGHPPRNESFNTALAKEAQMAASRLLIVESINDDLTKRRIASKQAKFAADDLSVEYCYALESTRRIDKQSLLDYIDRKINSFRPDLMIVHAGFVFSQHPETFLSVLTELSSKHPLLRIGSQMSEIEPGWKSRFALVFEDTKEIRDLAMRLV
ncbi:MAG TPA: hypothetical protein VFC15_08555 [Candidatus Limnocylindrales bacterium]|nr:hypothetical protein [Candidatus Limnocylindrales bacterium]